MGLPPGRMTAISQALPAWAMPPPSTAGSRPARTSDDLPLPEVPTTATRRLVRNRRSRSSICSCRPKKR